MDATVGPYNLHFIAYQRADGTWRPFITIDKFDQHLHDFRRIVEKQPVLAAGFPSRQAAIEAARQEGNRMIATWQRRQV